jgi:glucose/arabinose dehydrogenase
MTSRSRKALLALLLVLALVVVACRVRGLLAGIVPSPAGDVSSISVPAGFQISVYAADVAGARAMALGPDGIVFVGSLGVGNVYAIVDRGGEPRATETIVIASELAQPNGVAFRDGTLYVGEVNRILKFPDIAARLRNPPPPAVVTDAFPTDRHHGWKVIRFGPDGKLYVPVGAPCNVCEPARQIYATITRLDVAGGAPEIVARGVRNSVGFDWHPATGELWFTDNGRDWLGDDRPPDELNRATRPGLHFGFPYCHGTGIPDPELNKGRECAGFIPPARELGAHVAALGMRFYTGTMFPERYRGGVFIAEHGSWNRSSPVGYRVSFVGLRGNEATSYEMFAEGWLRGAVAWGRPADVLVLPDGSLLVSDDKAGRIYRISYAGPR